MIRHERWLLKVLLCAAAVSAAGCYGSDEIPKLKGPGVLQFSTATYSVSETALTVTINVTRTGGREGMVGISYATSNGSALQPGDYAAVTGTLSWADGDMEAKTFTVAVEDDPTPEGDETVNLALSLPTGGATLGLSAAVLTIVDNDAPAGGVFQFESAAYGVNEGAGTVTITVTRTGGSTGDVSVNYFTTNGSAVAPGDYTAIPQAPPSTLNWSSGDSSPKTFTVTIVDDAPPAEALEDFTVTLDGPVGGVLGTVDVTTVTITDNDNNGTLAFSAAAYSVDETGTTATITVTRTGGSQGVVGVTYATADGTAVQPDDYATATGTLSWPEGNTDPQTFNIDIVDDSLDEGDQTVSLSLASPTGGALLGLNAATLTILDNDSAGTLAFSSAAYGGLEDGGPVTIVVTRTGGSSGAVSVNYSTSDGTATVTPGNDYTAASGTLNWTDGDSASKSFTVTPTADANLEPNETVNLTLSSPGGGASLGLAGAVMTIQNDEDAGTIQFDSGTYSVVEGTGAPNTVTITVTRTGGTAGTVTVNYATSNGTAGNSDYVKTSGVLTWPDGVGGAQTFDVTTKDDTKVEPDQTVNLTLSPPTGGATLGTPSTAVLTIQDDD